MFPRELENVNLAETVKSTKPKFPVWAGPESSADNGGISQSLLGRFLVDRERFRLYVVEGLRPMDAFNHRLEYGNMWHICEEASTRKQIKGLFGPLDEYRTTLIKKHPYQRQEVEKWYEVCKVQFPIYKQHWAQHNEITLKRKSLLPEQVFHVPYTLPSGRVVYLRGKWDSIDLFDDRLFLWENKTKGDINPEMMRRQLKFDLQTMFYLVAFDTDYNGSPAAKSWQKGMQILRGEGSIPAPQMSGILYNVVRRPLSGGRYTITPHKGTANKQAEPLSHFYARLATLIWSDPEFFFMRWKVEIGERDILSFRRTCLDPVLEQLCDWWCWIIAQLERSGDPFDYCGWTKGKGNHGHANHYRMPYGINNPLIEGRGTDMDVCLDTGNRVGLEHTSNLFPELQ